ncbi:PAS domain-containing hybrid sensor histidine kinase/response regulator [Alkalitalea saponilacus]|uniref:histidine kinase n=1 Tax=Alkalitalea saponilacus TaxID=889453 RepID=A0A1T5F912_9BACT|nr:PAS domain-containing hybrid sensor histidine kinase/response regulator [Alkalitalea saponilacus]ASB50131.1 hypothetical protein CDL62_13780 [Alkalitalea saponilacus]SKB92518.1 Signal transduction histidine kinase [Alkalitalea saponilacus]
MFKTSIKKSWVSALTISVLYLVAGLLWIYFSDRIRLPFVVDKDTMTMFQTYKGAGYVSVTAILLFLLIYRQIQKRSGLILLLKKRNRLLVRVLQNQPGMNVLITDINGEILQSYGHDLLWKDLRTVKLTGKNINHWPLENEQCEVIQNFHKSIWRKGKSTTELRINADWYLFSGSLLNKKDSAREYALIVLRRINNEKLIEEEKETLVLKSNTLSSKLKDLETELEFQRRRLTTFSENIGEGVMLCSINRSGQIDEVELINQKALNYFGLVSREVAGKDLWRNLRFKGRDDQTLLLNNNFRERQRLILYAATFNESQVNEIELKAQYIFLEGYTHVMIVLRETEIGEKDVVNTPAIFDALAVLNSLSDGAMLLYPDLRIYFCNDSMKILLNLDNCELENPGIRNLINDGIDVDVLSYLDETLNGNVTKTTDFKFPGNPDKWFNSVFYPIFDRNGNVRSILRITQDVTSRREYEQVLSEQQSQADESNRLKSVFLSNLSHEVRTPMNGILGFVELLEHDGLSESQNYYLKLIRESCDNLLNILNILIEVSRIESGEYVVEKSWFEIYELIDYLNEEGKELLNKSGKHNIQFKIEEKHADLNERIYCEKEMLMRVLKLLLDNAVKFTQEGHIRSGIRILNNDHLLFWVEDTGVGINKNIHQSIYLPFTTVSDSESVLYGGLGLGLTIVKGLIDMLGGSIDLDSEPGIGSRFTIKIPLRVSNSKKESDEEKSVLKVGKVLIVQYGYEKVDELKAAVNHHNVQLLFATNGSEAIDLLFDHKDIDVVFTDVRLSDMDGFELFKAIKKMYPPLPVIAQASYMISEEKQRCLRAGFDKYLVKPIDPTQFFKILSVY